MWCPNLIGCDAVLACHWRQDIPSTSWYCHLPDLLEPRFPFLIRGIFDARNTRMVVASLFQSNWQALRVAGNIAAVDRQMAPVGNLINRRKSSTVPPSSTLLFTLWLTCASLTTRADSPLGKKSCLVENNFPNRLLKCIIYDCPQVIYIYYQVEITSIFQSVWDGVSNTSLLPSPPSSSQRLQTGR